MLQVTSYCTNANYHDSPGSTKDPRPISKWSEVGSACRQCPLKDIIVIITIIIRRIIVIIIIMI